MSNSKRILLLGGDYLSARTIKKKTRMNVTTINSIDEVTSKDDIVIINNFGMPKERSKELLIRAQQAVGEINANLAYESFNSDLYDRTKFSCRQLTTGVLSLAH